MKINDKVKIITGKDKNKEGIILNIDKVKNRVIVQGIKLVTKHEKPKDEESSGGIIQTESWIDISNVKKISK